MQPTLGDDSVEAPEPPPSTLSEGADGAFVRVWSQADPVPGWLTRDQGRALFETARSCPAGGVVVEIGSHQGRSTIVLASAREDVQVVAVDPHRAGGKFGGSETARHFTAHLERSGVRHRVDHRSVTSAAARATWSGPIDVLYIDGKHDYWTVLDDLRWTKFVRSEGTVLIHDVFGSLGVTSALLVHQVRSGTLVYVDRQGSLARFRPGHATWTDRRRFASGLPWFARNLVVKVLLRARLHSFASRLGHAGPDDPF